MIVTVPYSIAVSKLRRPFLSPFFIVVRLLRQREKFTEPDFAISACIREIKMTILTILAF